MSLMLNKFQLAASLFRTNFPTKVIPVKFIHSSFVKFSEPINPVEDDKDAIETVPISKDRSKIIPVEDSIRYLKSRAYRQTYGNDPVYKLYKRNYKGHFMPYKTRKTCIRAGVISTGSPCPICRDEYLILDYRNIDLIKQFISEHSGAILDCNFTGLCRKAQNDLYVAILMAKETGLLTTDVPFRYYNYSEFAIVGGGIAGVSCAEGIAFLAPDQKILLITASPLVKALTNVVPLGKTLMQFDVQEKDAAVLTETHQSLRIVHDFVTKVNVSSKTLETSSGRTVSYEMLCLCNGARPKLIAERTDFILGIRDTESVLQFSRKIKNARRIVIVGNGGIATEMVHEVDGIEMIWVIKDKHISATFIDPGAAQFFTDKVYKSNASANTSRVTKRMRYTVSDAATEKGGPALGPDWHNAFDVKGTFLKRAKVQVEYECEIGRILDESEREQLDPSREWPVYVRLTNGKTFGCDFIVSATGVTPNSDLAGLENLKRGEDGGFLVDWKLETSEENIYAAGDACTAGWQLAKHWFQMRLWTQAHQMGRYAAKSMLSKLKREHFLQDFSFELFSHVTKFFGYKIVLLGLYNGQKLDNAYEILLRVTKGVEYVKLVLKDGKMQGAVLIGDTDLEEMCENLILNQLDLSVYGEDLLNPDIDIEDYFD